MRNIVYANIEYEFYKLDDYGHIVEIKKDRGNGDIDIYDDYESFSEVVVLCILDVEVVNGETLRRFISDKEYRMELLYEKKYPNARNITVNCIS